MLRYVITKAITPTCIIDIHKDPFKWQDRICWSTILFPSLCKSEWGTCTLCTHLNVFPPNPIHSWQLLQYIMGLFVYWSSWSSGCQAVQHHIMHLDAAATSTPSHWQAANRSRTWRTVVRIGEVWVRGSPTDWSWRAHGKWRASVWPPAESGRGVTGLWYAYSPNVATEETCWTVATHSRAGMSKSLFMNLYRQRRNFCADNYIEMNGMD